MKKVLVLLAVVLTLSTLAFVKSTKLDPTELDPTEYYWFDPNTGQYIRQNTIEEEMFITQYNEGTYPPKTLREYGYAPSSVIIAPPADPEPIWGPDKALYSHP